MMISISNAMWSAATAHVRTTCHVMYMYITTTHGRRDRGSRLVSLVRGLVPITPRNGLRRGMTTTDPSQENTLSGLSLSGPQVVGLWVQRNVHRRDHRTAP